MDAEDLGEVLGEVLGIDTMGDDDDIDGMSTVGRRRRRRRRMLLPAKPSWRMGQLAPGVQAPREGLETLPLVPQAAGGIFSATVTSIPFVGRPQRPFRGERLLASVRRVGATTAGIVMVTNGIFVGTSLQSLQQGNFDLEFFTSTAFGVRLDLMPAEPGIDISLNVLTSGGAPGGTDTIQVQLLLLGRSLGG